MDYTNTIQKLYIAYYQRPADPGGLAYWTDRLEKSGGDLTAIIDAFATSPESQSLYGGKSVEEVLSEIYQAAFNRDPDPEGLQFYSSKIASGEYSLTDVLLRVLDGARGDDAEILNKKIQLANEFTQQVESNPEEYNYQGEEVASRVREWFKNAISSPDAKVPGVDELKSEMHDIFTGHHSVAMDSVAKYL